MDSALLHGKEININSEFIMHFRIGKNQSEIKEILENKYRDFAKKSAFRCICCGSIVNLIMPLQKKFHFRHKDNESCTYSDNYDKYTAQVKKYEQGKHDIGKTLIRTYLQGQLNPLHIPVIEGYRYRSKLSIVPDLIVEFPSGVKWALDFLTGLRNNKSYTEHISNRRMIYEEHGFKSYFFIDTSWLAINEITPYTTLIEAEEQLLMNSSTDKEWKLFLNKFQPEEKEYIQNQKLISNFNVRSIAYFDINNRECTILRLIKKKYSDSDYYIVHKPTIISMEEALSVNLKYEALSLLNLNEEIAMNDFKEIILEKYHLYLASEEETRRAVNRSREGNEKAVEMNSLSTFIPPSKGSPNEIAKAYMLHNMGIKVTPEYLNKKEKELKRKRELLLNKSVVYESYIQPISGWKEIVLDNFFSFHFEQIDFNELRDLVINSEVDLISEDPKKVEYAISMYIDVIKKEIKLQ